MMAFLSIMPIRLRALSQLTLVQSVLVTADRITIALSEEMTKNHLPWESVVPAPLDGILQIQLNETRVWLMARTNARHDRLWVTLRGAPLGYGRMKDLLGQVTSRELGINISPHLLSDLAVTTPVRSSPQDGRLTRPLLAHASFGLEERHYNHARGIEVGRDHAAILSELKQTD